MEKKTDDEILLEHMPDLKIWYKVLLLYTSQIIIFIFAILFFWQISSIFLFGSLIGEFIIVFCGTLPYHYMVTNIDKIRRKYLEKYGNLAGQQLWYRYESYTIPLLSSSVYFPILLRQNFYFFPTIINLPDHFVSCNIFPEYVAIFLGVFIAIIGFLIGRPSGGFGSTVETYINLLYPKKGTLITGGIYQYIRNPRYLGRGLIAVGFGFTANNLLAIFVGIIHFCVFCSLIISEDKELSRRFGSDFDNYKKTVPALFPKYGNWRRFIRSIFKNNKHGKNSFPPSKH